MVSVGEEGALFAQTDLSEGSGEVLFNGSEEGSLGEGAKLIVYDADGLFLVHG